MDSIEITIETLGHVVLDNGDYRMTYRIGRRIFSADYRVVDGELVLVEEHEMRQVRERLYG